MCLIHLICKYVEEKQFLYAIFINLVRMNSFLTIQKAKLPENYKPSIRGNFMQNSMEQYNQIRTQTNSEMELELERMPIGKFQ